MNILETARTLCAVSGPSGFEDAAARAVRALLDPLVDEVHTDALGNLIGIRRSKKADHEIKPAH